LKGHCWLFTPDLCHHAIDEQALQAKFHPHFAGGVANVLKDTGRITLQNVERNSKKNSSELWWKFYKGYSRNWFQSFRISGYRRIGVCYTGRFMSIGFKWCQFDSITLYIYIFIFLPLSQGQVRWWLMDPNALFRVVRPCRSLFEWDSGSAKSSSIGRWTKVSASWRHVWHVWRSQ
jgi:hypothetical protein